MTNIITTEFEGFPIEVIETADGFKGQIRNAAGAVVWTAEDAEEQADWAQEGAEMQAEYWAMMGYTADTIKPTAE